MDAFTIATTAAGIVKSCYMITATIYAFIDDSRNVDSTVDDLLREIQSLSKAVESIGSAWTQNQRAVMAQTGVDGNLWGSVEAPLEDCQLTLARLNSKLDELNTGSLFGRGFLRKPTKLVMLNMRIKDIISFKGQIQSYNTAMQSALLMINVRLMLNSNSSQESMSHALVGLKTQIGRVETVLHGQLRSGNTAPELAADSDRMTRNLRNLIREAESLHSSASTIVGDTRSTVWGGSDIGDPLSEEKYRSIRNWIPQPAIEEEIVETKEGSSLAFLDSALGDEPPLDQESDADSDIERDLVKRYRDIALSSLEQKDYSRAESFYRKIIEMNYDFKVPADELQDLNIMLGFSCALQENWIEAERIFPPIAFAKGIQDIRAFHGLYALSMVHFMKHRHDTATRFCKRAVGGYRRLLGNSSSQYFEAMAVLAQFYDSQGDSVSAEGCRTFLPTLYHTQIEVSPQVFLETVIGNGPKRKEAQSRLRSTTPIPPPSGPSGESSSQSQSHFGSQAGASPTALHLLSETSSSSIEAINRRLGGQSLMPRPLFSLPLGASNKSDGAKSLEQTSDTLAYQRQLLANHSSVNVVEGQSSKLEEPRSQSQPSISHQKRPRYLGPTSRSGPSPQLRNHARLIVAVDFGTTQTAVGWALVGKEGAREEILSSWPGCGHGKQTIPTELYYDKNQNVVGWARDISDALAPTGYPKPGVLKVEWFKPQLMLNNNSYIDLIHLPPLPQGKSEIAVAADYLFRVRQVMRSELSKTLGEVFSQEERQILYYFSRPGIWSDVTQHALLAAIIQAGFLRDENDNRLTLITESEATALFCLKNSMLKLDVKDVVLVVNCGTGTVDLQACELASENPLSFAEFAPGSGDSCGSTAISRNFSKIVRARIRKMKLPDSSKIARRVYAESILDFNNRIKDDFRNSGQKWAVEVGIESEFPEAGIKNGYIVFENDEILSCFEPVVDRIIQMIRNQIMAVGDQHTHLQNILITGAFGANEYLFQQIKLHCPPQLQAKVVRPMDGGVAVVRGLLAAGIEHFMSIKDEVECNLM